MFSIEKIKEYLVFGLKGKVQEISLEKDTFVIFVHKDDITEVLGLLKNGSSLKMEQLISICGIDYPNDKERFVIVYNLLSLSNNLRVRVKVKTDSNVPSVFSVYKNAVWYEREVFDMFGVNFIGNPDPRRILSDYEFEGYPLRKDFPLSGHKEVIYDEKQGRVVYVPVNIEREHREYQ